MEVYHQCFHENRLFVFIEASVLIAALKLRIHIRNSEEDLNIFRCLNIHFTDFITIFRKQIKQNEENKSDY